MQMGLTASTRLEAAAAEGDIPGKKNSIKKNGMSPPAHASAAASSPPPRVIFPVKSKLNVIHTYQRTL
jgi:hypothetical protein